MTEIIRVETREQQKEFVEFPLRMYKNDPYYAPELYGDALKVFTSENVYHNTCDDVFFLAKRNGQTVGRIQGINAKATYSNV